MKKKIDGTKKGLKRQKRNRILEKRYKCHKTRYACYLVHLFKPKNIEIPKEVPREVPKYDWVEQKLTLWRKIKRWFKKLWEH